MFATSINLPYISYSGPVGATVSLKRIRSSSSNKDLLANYEFILSLSLSLFPTLLYRCLKSIKNQESMEQTSVSFSSLARFNKELNKFNRFHAVATTTYVTRSSG